MCLKNLLFYIFVYITATKRKFRGNKYMNTLSTNIYKCISTSRRGTPGIVDNAALISSKFVV